jgi:metal-responsive CopG/Arc/MetJ family transcriptional regulator
MWVGIHMNIEARMLKTIQITLPDDLLTKIDRTVAELDTNRSGFARQAFEEALFRLWVAKMERQHAEAYASRPEDPDEMARWESIQDWGEPYAAR